MKKMWVKNCFLGAERDWGILFPSHFTQIPFVQRMFKNYTLGIMGRGQWYNICTT